MSLLFFSLLCFLYSTLSQSNDPSELLIWSCKSNGVNTNYYDPAVITFYAQTTTEIIIRSTLDPSAWVKTTPGSYALDSLRLGKSLSYTAKGGYVIPSGWTGPMSANMWNSCGQTDSFVTAPYWSCNNGNGLHLVSNYCGWSTNLPTPGGISIFIKRQLDVMVPIWRCYSNGVNIPLTTPENLNAIGSQASAITIYTTKNPAEFVKTSSPTSYAIKSLTQGISLSYTTSGGYATTSDWVGSSYQTPSSMMWNSCGQSYGTLKVPYWSCNNGNGLHLTEQTCSWTSSGNTPNGGITVAVTPSKPAPYRLVRIWSCSPGTPNAADFNLDTIKGLANYAKGITIMSRANSEEYVTTKSSTSYALASLKQGKSLSFTTTGGYAIVDDWIGSKVTQIWNSCGTPSDFTTTPYWSCNNGNGLHLTATSCGWTSSTSTPGGIGVYIHLDAGFSAAIQGTTLSLLGQDNAFAHPTTVTAQPESGLSRTIIGVSVGAGAFVIFIVVVVIVVLVVKKKAAIDENKDYLIYQ
eukprot:TRINITY_DN44_c0_g1_i5.p1 TRINITY_DN44_c0_g1~~TRINITY_DN44_c0_g1_i5.p1  ORF type:complete len:521 (-),score=82.81 TRINITY_DN44_c0_g1_i5:52-1614(-)